jgi:predicted acylesterase/phospholipase RssA
VSPDLLVGTSAGALNAAFIAGHGTGHAALRQLAYTGASVQRRDISPSDPCVGCLQSVVLGHRCARSVDCGA